MRFRTISLPTSDRLTLIKHFPLFKLELTLIKHPHRVLFLRDVADLAYLSLPYLVVLVLANSLLQSGLFSFGQIRLVQGL